MTRLLLAGVACVAAVLTSQPLAQQSRATFRATTDMIMVPVAVHERGDADRPVRGLTADHFEVLDDGVVQEIELVALDTIPIDVTVVLDASGSLSELARVQLRRDVEELAGLLGPSDRLGALSFDATVTELAALQPADQMMLAPAVQTYGTTAFYHAVVAALLKEADPARPHLIIALTDGADNVSFLDEADVLSVAQRSNAVLTILVRNEPAGTFRGWAPFRGKGSPDALKEAAETTGGTAVRQARFKSAKDLFEQTINEFKTGYLLWFKPDANGLPGWHEITVTTPGMPDSQIRARRGYVASR